MKKYDLHLHTKYSRCSLLEPDDILKEAKKKGLDGIAITDHNTIKGALEVKRSNKDKNFEVIVGEEVMTDIGEILVYYVKEEIKPGKFEDVIKEVKKQGAICSIAHPYAIGIRKKLDVDFKKLKGNVDAVEGFNARSLFDSEITRSQELAKKLRTAMTAGSDGHFRSEIGRAYTEFDDDLRKALKEKKTEVKGKKTRIGLLRIASAVLKLFRS